MQGLTTIHLGGKLGQLFGKRWDLMVASPAEAIRAIDVNLKGELRKYLSNDGAKKFYKVGIGKKDALIDKEELGNRSGNSPIFIRPTVKGRSSGAGKMIAGIVLIVVGAILAAPTGGGSSFMIKLGTGLIFGGVGLVIGGVVQLLTPVPNFNNNNQGDSRGEGSTFFQGGSAAISQGGAVGLVYGRALVTPMPISISTNNTDRSKPDVAGIINRCVTEDGNGLVQYPALEDGEVCP